MGACATGACATGNGPLPAPGRSRPVSTQTSVLSRLDCMQHMSLMRSAAISVVLYRDYATIRQRLRVKATGGS
jgi:hypothetical protein